MATFPDARLGVEHHVEANLHNFKCGSFQQRNLVPYS